MIEASEQWENAPADNNKLLELNRSYINYELVVAPYQCRSGALTLRRNRHPIENLLRLHDFGFFVYASHCAILAPPHESPVPTKGWVKIGNTK